MPIGAIVLTFNDPCQPTTVTVDELRGLGFEVGEPHAGKLPCVLETATCDESEQILSDIARLWGVTIDVVSIDFSQDFSATAMFGEHAAT